MFGLVLSFCPLDSFLSNFSLNFFLFLQASQGMKTCYSDVYLLDTDSISWEPYTSDGDIPSERRGMGLLAYGSRRLYGFGGCHPDSGCDATMYQIEGQFVPVVPDRSSECLRKCNYHGSCVDDGKTVHSILFITIVFFLFFFGCCLFFNAKMQLACAILDSAEPSVTFPWAVSETARAAEYAQTVNAIATLVSENLNSPPHSTQIFRIPNKFTLDSPHCCITSHFELRCRVWRNGLLTSDRVPSGLFRSWRMSPRTMFLRHWIHR
jgi:hypothetical protein